MSANTNGNSFYISNQNQSSGGSAYTTGINVSNDLGQQFTIFTNSSGRLLDGGNNTTTIRSTSNMVVNSQGGLLTLSSTNVSLSGNIGFLGNITSDITMGSTQNIYVASNRNSGGTVLNIRNSNSGSSAFSNFTMGNDTGAGNFIIFQNSSTRSADGGVGATTIRTDSGDLRISSAGTTVYCDCRLNVKGYLFLDYLDSTSTIYFMNNAPSTATSGAATLPSNPVGFVRVNVGGTMRKIPYYAE
eukprot:GHVO01001290.1.p1 GENE.GHVO01001290.1~~GHVO01001290.1.p1  ORF type:complete len:252 (-),score=-6.40 GHVO01001290.1:432-1163(-)